METDIFRCVKQNVTARNAAERYGIRVSGNGMARCPFHPDRTPSMKIDARYHCFGCGADGDVISFVSRLFNLKPIDSARKIAEDFGITIPERGSLSRDAKQQNGRRKSQRSETGIGSTGRSSSISSRAWQTITIVCGTGWRHYSPERRMRSQIHGL